MRRVDLCSIKWWRMNLSAGKKVKRRENGGKDEVAQVRVNIWKLGSWRMKKWRCNKI